MPRRVSMMTHHRRILGWLLLVGSVVSGAIASFGNNALAQSQIVPDRTLGAERSVVVPNLQGLPVEALQGGAIRGANLFHSFLEFNVSPGRGAFFFSPSAGIHNILARVTGNNPSTIFGTLGTYGNSRPNLFLINPNGIIFGPNASLSVGGSFVATTANAVQLGSTGLFSASEPSSSQLLDINPSAFLFNALSHGAIINSSTATTTLFGFPTFGLAVPNGQSLLLVGGDVRLEGGNLAAPGGRVELGGLAGAGTVGLNADGRNLSLSFPVGVPRADVSLTNGARVGVIADGGGSIAVNARDLDISGGSTLGAGIEPSSQAASNRAGDIEVDATDTVNVAGTSSTNLSSILNSVIGPQAVGTAGNIIINTGTLNLIGQAEIGSLTSGQGNAGSVTIRARDTVSLSGFGSAVFSNVFTGVGNASDVTIETRSLSLSNDAILSTSTNLGTGNAGNIRVNATDSVSVKGDSFLTADTSGEGKAGDVTIAGRDGFVPVVSIDGMGVVSTFVAKGAMGRGGDINIQARSLAVTNGGQIDTSTSGQGSAGSVSIQGDEAVVLDHSEIFSFVDSGAVGNAGNISLQAGSLSLTDGAELLTDTFGQGNAGSVFVQTNNFSLNNSLISSAVQAGGVGNGGDIAVQARSLSLANGSQLISAVIATQNNLPGGQGRGGNISVNATDSVNLAGVGTDGISSGLFSSTARGASGRAGDIAVNTGALRLTDGALIDANTRNASDGGNITINANTLDAVNGGQVLTATFDRGRAGNITINASDSVTLEGSDPTFASRLAQFGRDGINNFDAASGLFANTQTNSTGGGGGVKITTGQLQVLDGAQIVVSSQGTGNAGDLEATARSIKLDNRGQFSAETASGDGGNINLQAQDLLLLRHNSLFSTSAGTAKAGGNGGNITINTPFIVAVPNENSDIRANAFTGNGGRVDITAQGIFGIQFRPQDTPLSDITASSQFGLNGSVQINTSGIDPSRGISDLPVQPVDAAHLIAQNCPAGGGQVASESQFVVTGRGGLPPTPRETLSDVAVLEDWGTRTLAASSSQVRTPSYPASEAKPQALGNHLPNSTTSVATVPINPLPIPFVEAQGWMYGPHGEVILTAALTNSHPSLQSVPSCGQLNKQH